MRQCLDQQGWISVLSDQRALDTLQAAGLRGIEEHAPIPSNASAHCCRG